VAVVLVIAEVVAQAVSVEAEPVVALVAQELLAQPTLVAVAVAPTKRLLLVLVVAVYLLSVLSYQPASQTQPLLLLVEL
jgi:hypothetical protein